MPGKKNVQGKRRLPSRQASGEHLPCSGKAPGAGSSTLQCRESDRIMVREENGMRLLEHGSQTVPLPLRCQFLDGYSGNRKESP